MQRFDSTNMPLDQVIEDFYVGRAQSGDAPLSPTATFRCQQFHCQMTVGTCIKRQLAKSRAGKAVHPPCGKADMGYVDADTGTSPCEQGNDHFARIGDWRPEEYRPTARNWVELRTIRRGLDSRRS